MLINDLGFDELNRPCNDLYFMNLCFEVARKSLDPHTQHGCIAVNESGGIITTGYNGPVKRSIDQNIPLTRPEKYKWMKHSEKNVICWAAYEGKSLKDSSIYITGLPCFECLGDLMQVEVKEIIYGPLNSIMLTEEGYFDDYRILLINKDIKIKKFKYIDGLFQMNPRVKELIKECPDIDFEFLAFLK